MKETKFIGKSIRFFDVIDSTNSYAKKIAAEGCENGTVVIAGKQTLGRGRMGRVWDSPDNAGIWMSVVLRPFLPPGNVQIITLGASIAAASAIRQLTGLESGIKWPNDLIIGGKKVCGILTEANCKMDQVNFIILGIGINISQKREDFPEELRNTAVSLKSCMQEKGMSESDFKKDDLIDDLIKVILIELERIYAMISSDRTAEIIEEWKKYSITLGREVKINFRDGEYTGTAVDVTDDGRLVVDCSDGITRKVLSGEVSVRGMLGYV